MTGLCDDWTISPSSVALATACLEVSKHQQEFQRRGSKHHKGPCGVAMAAAAPLPPGVDVHADLFISGNFNGFVRDALLAGAASLLRLKFREFHAKEFTASEIVSLLQSLDPSCVRRVHLCYYQLPELSVILPHLSRFPELRSLKLESSDIDMRHLTPELASGIQCLSRPLGMLPSLRELDLEFSMFSVNLHQILCDLQAPLESLELASCYVLPSDLAYLSQSFHARALKKLNLKDHRLSQSLLEPLQQLLEASSASLLDLELEYCCLADSHLNALLPTILRCSRLRFLLLYGNPLSIAALKNLLQKTLELPDLRLVLYPLPVDCSNQDPLWDDDLIDRIVDERLTDLSAEISQMLANSGRTDLVWTYDLDDNQRTAMDYFSL